MNVIDEIKARLDIVDYIGRYAQLKPSGAYHKACCPFHSEKTPSFMVSAERQTWRCYGACGEGGDVIAFAMKYHGWTIQEALDELCKLAGIRREKHDKQADTLAERLSAVLRQAQRHFSDAFLGSPAADYWQSRGYSLELAQTWGIGYASQGWDTLTREFLMLEYSPEDLIDAGISRRSEQGRLYDYFRHRLTIPIRDARGRLVGFGARALSAEDNPKYLNSPASVFEKERYLFGYDRARDAIQHEKRVILVEGYLDVIACHAAGYLNVVGQMGTALSESQRKLLQGKDIIFALDADEAGQSSTRRSVEALRGQDHYIRVVKLTGAKDPAEAIQAGTWNQALIQAPNVLEWLIEREAVLDEHVSETDRVHQAQKVLKILAGFGGAVEQEWAKELLAKRLNISSFDLRRIKTEPAVRLRVVPAPSAPIHAPIEAHLLSAYLHNIRYLRRCQRELREMGLAELSAEDFVSYSQTFQVMLDALDQLGEEEVDYIRSRLSADLLTWEGVMPISAEDEPYLIVNALRLRMQTIQRHLESTIELEQREERYTLVRQREQVRALLAEKTQSALRRSPLR